VSILKKLFQAAPFLGRPSNKPGHNDLDPNYSENLKQIENALGEYPENEAKYIAAFALVLGRVAYADNEITDKERAKMKTILSEKFNFSEAKVLLVSNLACERIIKSELENHIVLRHLNAQTSNPQKIEILKSLFQLAAEDDISEKENADIQLVSKAFGFSHREYIDIRSEYKEHLAVLRNLPK